MMLLTAASLSLTLVFHPTPTAPPQFDLPSAPSPVLSVRADSTPLLLTVNALTRMTAFWTSFMKEPPAIRDTAHDRHIKAYPADLSGVDQVAGFNFERVDMEAMAAQYPSVAKDFKRAGLTPHQWMNLRQALYNALLLQLMQAQGLKVHLAPTDVRWKNITFLKAHPKELNALKATGMWLPE